MPKSPFDFGKRVRTAFVLRPREKGFYWWWFVLNRMSMDMAERVERWEE